MTSTNTLIELLQQKAKIDGEIRRYRVIALRRAIVGRRLPKVIQAKLLHMEEMLSGVVYNYTTFDDLLTEVEERLSISEEQ